MIETSRMLLRHWRVEDADALYKYASDRRVSELALWPQHTSLAMSREVIEQIFIPNSYSFAVELKESGEAIGCIGLVPETSEHYHPAPFEREVGYWIGRPYWNRGLVTEALFALIGYCRDVMGLHSLLITVDAVNAASRRVAEKCGFALIEHYTYEGVPSKAYRLHLK